VKIGKSGVFSLRTLLRFANYCGRFDAEHGCQIENSSQRRTLLTAFELANIRAVIPTGVCKCLLRQAGSIPKLSQRVSECLFRSAPASFSIRCELRHAGHVFLTLNTIVRPTIVIYHLKRTTSAHLPEVLMTQCTSCNGTARCKQCKGTGILVIRDSVQQLTIRVRGQFCQSSGVCRICRGSGTQVVNFKGEPRRE